MLLCLLVVRFGRGRRCAFSVSFFRSSFRQFSGRKDGETYFPPLNQHSHSSATRMYAPSAHKATSPQRGAQCPKRVLPRDAPSSQSQLLLPGDRIAMRYRVREVRLLLALLTAVARTNPVVVTSGLTEFLVVAFSLSSI